MDVLSHILDSIELRGHLYFPTDFRARWGLAVPANSNVCRFHVVVEGSCLLSGQTESVWLSRGDLALVPHGREHFLQDDAETPLVDLDHALTEREYQGVGCFRWGEDGDRSRLVCGHFEFDNTTHPLLDTLPELVHVKATPTYDFGWIDQVMRLIGEETHTPRPGSGAISRRLSEILFVQVLRHYAESESGRDSALAALTDPRLSRALHAMHTRPENHWTLEQLASEAAMSRTAFAVRFSELLGISPMKYLTEHRMRQAARLVRQGEPIGAIADRVGYRSEAALARKFKTTFGVSPGAYRRGASAVDSRRDTGPTA